MHMKKDTKQSKQTKKVDGKTEKEIHDAWIEKTKLKAAMMLALAHDEYERNQAARVKKFGRWASVVDALEDVARATFDVAKTAVRDCPREVAKVQRVHDAVVARLDGDHKPTAELPDVAFTLGLLAHLADRDFGVGISTLPDALLAVLGASPFGRDTSLGFARR